MKIRYHCEVCDQAYETATEAEACEKKPAPRHEIGAKLVCFGVVVRILERSGIGRGNHDYLYRAEAVKEENPADCHWSTYKYHHHGQFKPVESSIARIAALRDQQGPPNAGEVRRGLALLDQLETSKQL